MSKFKFFSLSGILIFLILLTSNSVIYAYDKDLLNDYMNQHKYKEAIELLKKDISINPKDSFSYSQLADVYRKQKNYNEAIKWLKEGLRVNYRDSSIYIGFGKVYRDMRNYSEALKWLNEGLRSCIDQDRINEFLGRLYIVMKEYDKAEKVLNSVVEGKKVEDFAYWGCPFQALGELYTHMAVINKNKILDNYKKSADIDKYKDDAQFATAKICFEYGDNNNAMEYIERAINLARGREYLNDYILLKGYILINAREYSKAEKVFKQIAEKGSGRYVYEARVGLGHTEIIKKNYKDAEMYFRDMLNIDKSNIMANLGMAWIFSGPGAK